MEPDLLMKECQIAVVGCQYYPKSLEVLSLPLSDFVSGTTLEIGEFNGRPMVSVHYGGHKIGSVSEDYVQSVIDFIEEANSNGYRVVLDYVLSHKCLPDGKLRWFIARVVQKR